MNRREQWQLNGDAPEIYERYLVPAMVGPLAAGLLEMAELRPGERVLDIACGTGHVARLAAERVGITARVVGLDLNPQMLRLARSLPPPPGATVEWLQGSALPLPASSAVFDVVFCHQGLQYFPDRPSALREMCRTLAPGGRLALGVVGDIERNPVHARLVELLERHVGPDAAEILRAGFGLGNAEELWSLIMGAGFRGVRIQSTAVTVHFPSAEEFVRHQVTGSPLAEPVIEAGKRVWDALIRDARTAFQPYLTGKGLRFNMETNNAVAFR